MSTLSTPTALRILAARARTATSRAALPHLRRAYNGLTGELTAWHAAHEHAHAARTDAELEACRLRRHAEKIAVAASSSGETARDARIVLGSLLARPEVRRVLAPAIYAYYLERYPQVGAVAAEVEADEEAVA